MPTGHSQARAYDASDIRELMDNTGGWARNWDDVLRYLEGPAEKDSDFSKKEVPQLIEDVKTLKQEHAEFSTDYRTVWKELTGETADDLPPPEGVTKTQINPVELEDKYLRGLDFPAKKHDVVEQAEQKKAPSRVLDVLQRVESKEYREMAQLMESVGDVSWDHDRR